MDMHRRRYRGHNHQESTTTHTPTFATITPTTSESPSSTSPHEYDHQIFSHRCKSSTADAENASQYDSCDFDYDNRKIDEDEHEDDKYDDNEDDDEFSNVLSLKLRKPQHWKWELSTSKSCSNIALPRILLYDQKGELLVDANGDREGIYKQQDYEKSKCEKRCHQSRPQKSDYIRRSASSNLTHSISKAVEHELKALHIQEATPSPKRSSPVSVKSQRSHRAIDFNTTDLPDYSLSRRSSSLKSVRFNISKDVEDFPVCNSQVPEFLPTPPSTTTPTSSSSGPREKRRYRRSQSSGRSSAHSESILERFSYQRGRFSSPEFAEENEVQNGPRYFLRTSKAGTLVVKEDSFNLHPRRRRRRPLRNRSSESLHNVLQNATQQQQQQQLLHQTACRSPTPSDTSCNRKQKPLRRRLTDGNILLDKPLLTTSEEDINVAAGQNHPTDNDDSTHLHKYVQERQQTKDLNYSTDVHQNGKVR